MELEEFEHYFRICLDRVLSSEEVRNFVTMVEEHADVEPDDEDGVVVYHLDDKEGDGYPHCYDIRLEDDITADVGDDLAQACEQMFPDDDFDIESSMGIIDEAFEFVDLKLNNADRTQISENYNKWQHQRWVDNMVAEGWNFGMRLDESAKTHPALRPWEALSGPYKKDHSRTVEFVLEQIERMGYKFIR
jgi:hypothetical protein